MPGPDVLHLLFGGLGGQHRLVLDLAAGFTRAGLRSEAVALGRAGAVLSDPAAWPGVDRVHVVERGGRLDRTTTGRVRHILDGVRPRALLWHSGYAARAVRRARRRGTLATAVFVEHQSLGLRSVPEDVRSLAGIITADRTVLLSMAYRDRHRLRALGLPGLRDPAVVPNGVDVGSFRPGHGGRPAGPTRLVLQGRLVASRDAATAIAAVAVLASREVPVTLEILGDGPERPALEAIARDSATADRIRFCGWLAPDAVPDALRAADIYLHPSHGETRSTALLQAWATGLPVVAARVTGIDDLVRDGDDGLLVPPSDPVAIADAVQRLHDDSALAAELGAASRARAVAEFSAAATVRGYLGVLAAADPAGPWSGALSRVSS